MFILYPLVFWMGLRKREYISEHSLVDGAWGVCCGYLNSFILEDKDISCTINTMVVDDLVTQGDGASAAMVLT